MLPLWNYHSLLTPKHQITHSTQYRPVVGWDWHRTPRVMLFFSGGCPSQTSLRPTCGMMMMMWPKTGLSMKSVYPQYSVEGKPWMQSKQCVPHAHVTQVTAPAEARFLLNLACVVWSFSWFQISNQTCSTNKARPQSMLPRANPNDKPHSLFFRKGHFRPKAPGQLIARVRVQYHRHLAFSERTEMPTQFQHLFEMYKSARCRLTPHHASHPAGPSSATLDSDHIRERASRTCTDWATVFSFTPSPQDTFPTTR